MDQQTEIVEQPEVEVEVEQRVERLLLRDIWVNEEFNCRGRIIPSECVDLAKAIEAQGLIQPVTVCPVPSDMANPLNKKYLLVCGYRRVLAMHRILKWERVPSVISTRVDSLSMAMAYNLSENLKREDLDILQEALAIAKLKKLAVRRDAIMEQMGVSNGWLQIREQLLQLPVEIFPSIKAEFINQTDIRELYTMLRLEGRDACLEMAGEIREAKQKGNTRINKSSIEMGKKKKTKRARKKQEMVEMIHHLLATIGEETATFALAWGSGELSMGDFDTKMVQHIQAQNAMLENMRKYIIATMEGIAVPDGVTDALIQWIDDQERIYIQYGDL